MVHDLPYFSRETATFESNSDNLVGGLEHFLFFHIYWESSSQLTNIFQRGSNNQPAMVLAKTFGLF